MNKDAFWKIINDIAAKSAGDIYSAYNFLLELMAGMPTKELCRFQEILNIYIELTEKYVRDVPENVERSFEENMDFDLWIILQGKEFYFESLNAPNRLSYIIYNPPVCNLGKLWEACIPILHLRNVGIDALRQNYISSCEEDEIYKDFDGCKSWYQDQNQQLDLSLNNIRIMDNVRVCSGYYHGNLSPLLQYPNMDMIVLSGNNINDISLISEMKSLRSITLYETNITNLDALSGLNKLEEILCYRNRMLENIDGISNLPNMKKIKILGSKRINTIAVVEGRPLEQLMFEKTWIDTSLFEQL